MKIHVLNFEFEKFKVTKKYIITCNMSINENNLLLEYTYSVYSNKCKDYLQLFMITWDTYNDSKLIEPHCSLYLDVDFSEKFLKKKLNYGNLTIDQGDFLTEIISSNIKEYLEEYKEYDHHSMVEFPVSAIQLAGLKFLDSEISSFLLKNVFKKYTKTELKKEILKIIKDELH